MFQAGQNCSTPWQCEIIAINTVTHLIQLMIVPVVMVTACTLLINGMLQQYASINDRLRSMARERLDFWRIGKSDLTTPQPGQVSVYILHPW